MKSLQQKDLSHNSINISSTEIINIISYPRFDNKGYLDRMAEMESLGIKFVLHGGRSQIGKIAIAGKGCVSLVMKAIFQNNSTCALKIRRIDANRSDMGREVKLHKMANSIGVGPEIIGYSKNTILMDFVEGLSIIDWMKQDNSIVESESVLRISIDILEQCYLLDTIHLDHGQLSCLDHHAIISTSNKASLIDFESSSNQRRPSNVTCATQSLLLSGFISKRIKNILGLQNKKEQLIQTLKLYKACQTRENFDKIIDVLTK
jgi:putative serine/threonine protein kinase